MTVADKHSFDETRQLITSVVEGLKHCELLGITVFDAAPSQLKLKLPYSGHIIGNPENKVIHGGVLTTLMDTACGFAAILGCEEPSIAPTLDLRIDYMRSATPGKAVIGDAIAYRVTSTVIFARGTAYHPGEEDKPIAHCTASFMRISATPPIEETKSKHVSSGKDKS